MTSPNAAASSAPARAGHSLSASSPSASPSASPPLASSARTRSGSRSMPHSDDLTRSTTRDSVDSHDGGLHAITSVISSTVSFFKKRALSISHPEGTSPGATSTPVFPPAASPAASSRSRTESPPLHSPSSTHSRQATASPSLDPHNETATPEAPMPPPSATIDSAAVPPSRPQLLSVQAAESSAGSAESRVSLFSTQDTSTAASSPPQSPNRLGSAGPSSLTDPALDASPQPNLNTPQGVQMRLKSLPRLASYTITHPDASTSASTAASTSALTPSISSPLSRADSRDSEAGDEHDTNELGVDEHEDSNHLSMSGTETEHDTEDTETDEDDDEHDEEDVRGGAEAMRISFQRPVLPTLNSRSGGFSANRTTPFTTPSTFPGWTTFASSTPTPGPLRTARPKSGDNTINGSYFDARPTTPSRTPAQTPRPLSGDLGSAVRGSGIVPGGTFVLPSPMAPISGPPSRITIDPRQNTFSPPSGGRVPPSPANSVSSRRTIPASASGLEPLASVSRSPSPSRPAFYHRQSRSMVDLTKALNDSALVSGPSDRRSSGDTASPRSRSQSRPSSSSGSAGVATPLAGSMVITKPTTAGAVIEPIPESPVAAPSTQALPQSPFFRPLQRRQSMPEMRIDPPVYQIDDDFQIHYADSQIPAAREDEGREALPGYSCDVHIEGYVPRKMEFLKPGVQAKDRRWKRQYIILHGTSIKIYKSDPRAKAVPGEEAPPFPDIPAHKSEHRQSISSVSSRGSHLRSAPSARRNTVSSTASTASSAASGDSEKSVPWSPRQDAIASRRFDPDMPVHVHLQDGESGGLAPIALLAAKAGENRCIRHYTLQGAESGLAADYLKRRHVVRIRAEGEQFLIQAKDDRAVIDWIEALQAATNTALDLDVRPLPKFVTLPRRRRRRPRTTDPNAASTTNAGSATTTATTTNSGTNTITTSADQSGVTARSEAMNNMLAEDQDAYLARPNGMLS